MFFKPKALLFLTLAALTALVASVGWAKTLYRYHTDEGTVGYTDDPGALSKQELKTLEEVKESELPELEQGGPTMGELESKIKYYEGKKSLHRASYWVQRHTWLQVVLGLTLGLIGVAIVFYILRLIGRKRRRNNMLPFK